jgi:antitoxin component YwqK of YwqJK toxin-antitoxin module
LKKDTTAFCVYAFNNGKINGLGTGYYERGKLRFETVYNNREVVGTWTEYDEDGKLVELKMADDSG